LALFALALSCCAQWLVGERIVEAARRRAERERLR
jgi:hypothetical protein